jgi:predicted nucleotidyltransferase
MDLLMAAGAVWCVVDQLSWGWPARARPKYAPVEVLRRPFRGHLWTIEGREYSRVVTPEDLQLVLAALPGVFTPDGTVPPHRVGRHVSTIADRDACVAGRPSEVAGVTERLVGLLLEAGVPDGAVGVTGSTLLRAAIDGFSDVDLVVSGAGAIQQAMLALRRASEDEGGPRYRSPEEARAFYRHYDVITQLSDQQFARHLGRKSAQGVMDGVPFTVFTVPDAATASELAGVLPWLRAAATGCVTFRARMLDVAHGNYTAASRYLVQPVEAGLGGPVEVYCLDRACIDQAPAGALVHIEARPAGPGRYVVRPRDGVVLDLALGEAP